MKDLERALAEGPAPLWLVFGDARPLVDQAVDTITEAVLRRVGLPAFNHSVVRATESGASQALATARTLPMMAERRLVVVRELAQASDELLEAVVDYAGQPSETTVFVLTGDGFPKVRKGGKNWSARVQNAFKKQGRVLKLDTQGVPLVRFAQDEAARQGKRLDARDAELLVELVGQDLGRLQQEVTKVALYVGEREEIGADDLLAACSMVAVSVVWDLTAGIASRDPDKALAALHRQLEEGEDPRKILGMVVWQLRKLLMATEQLRLGNRPTGLPGDQIRLLQVAIDSGRARGAAEVMGRVAEANRHMNEHRAGDRRILERLILELCQG